MSSNEKRLYTIKEVSQKTGISTQLIRKWEERYGAVQPERYPNGYRGYSRNDIEKLLWLKSRVDSGVPIGLAIMDFDTANQEALSNAKSREIEELNSIDPEVAKSKLLESFLAMNLAQSQHYFDQLVQVHPIDFVLIHILQPMLVEIGLRWERGEVSEYQEHFASQFCRERIQSISALIPPAPGRPTLYTSCLPFERHEIGLIYFNYFALKQGFPIIYLGGSPSEKGLLDCIRHQKPVALLFSVATLEIYKKNETFLQLLDDVITKEKHQTKVFLGGRVIREDRLYPGTSHIFELAGDSHVTINKIRSYLFE
jgi:DNA-binding transcriptional MerR regulator